MTRVSSHALKKEAQDKLFSELARYIGKADHHHSALFLQTLLTTNEQIMLAKRIGVIALLHNGVSTYRIMQKLHMSSATIVRMHKAYEKGEYDAVTKLFSTNKKDWDRFMKILEVVLYGVFPSRAHDTRWVRLDRSFGRTRKAG